MIDAGAQRDRVQVSCIGGGPDWDLLGALKYTDSRGLSPAMKFFLYDREQAWSASFLLVLPLDAPAAAAA